MRAFAVRSFGEAPAIHDLPVPAVEDAFLIRVTYAGVNPIDYKLVEWLTAASAFPFIMGIDFAGVIERVPPEDRNLCPRSATLGCHSAGPQGFRQTAPLIVARRGAGGCSERPPRVDAEAEDPTRRLV